MIFVRPPNLGIEFEGGNSFQVPAGVGTLDEVRDAVTDAGGEVATAQEIGGENPSYRITTPVLDENPTEADAKSAAIRQEIAERFQINPSEISVSAVSGAWGSQVTERALLGTGIFLVAVVLYLAPGLPGMADGCRRDGVARAEPCCSRRRSTSWSGSR